MPAARDGDGAACDELVTLAGAAARAGIDLVQVRERGLGDHVLLRLVQRIVGAVEGHATRVVVNDRLDVALAAGAAGVHLKDGGPPSMRVRAMVPPGWVVGRSVHGADDARRPEQVDGVDYLICGTVFESASKPGRKPLGLRGLAAVTRASTSPVLAIGGIDTVNAARIAAAGAAGVAAIGLFADCTGARSVELAARVGALRRAFDKG